MEKIKKTILILPAVLIVLFAACSGDSLTSEEAERQAAGQQQAIGFGAYLNRTTRGGAPGSLVTSGASTNQVALQTTGFGVFARVATLANSGTGNVEFEATLTPTSKTGWHYLSDTPTATFTLTVNN